MLPFAAKVVVVAVVAAPPPPNEGFLEREAGAKKMRRQCHCS
jgi:hypothetical protein